MITPTEQGVAPKLKEVTQTLRVSVLFLLKTSQILLGCHLVGSMKDKLGAPGGKTEQGESYEACACRETFEEVCVKVSEEHLEQFALIDFYIKGRNGGNPVYKCPIFFCGKWIGEPRETSAMRPQWFPFKKIPYDEMMVADEKWLPLLLAGKKIIAHVFYNKDCTQVLDFQYVEVTTFRSSPVK